MLLLHGFPQFWWAWRHQMAALADAGYRAVAMDLRGYGASDKPPRGYDTYTLAADVASVIRSLGETDAVVVGHGWGGWIAWSMPTLQPRRDPRRRVPVDAAPAGPAARLVRAAGGSGRASRLPRRAAAPVRARARDDQRTRRTSRGSCAPGPRPFGGCPTPEDARRYGDAMAMPFVAHSAAEYYRWLGAQPVRQDGRRFVRRRIRARCTVPVLQLQGDRDGAVVLRARGGSGACVAGPYEYARARRRRATSCPRRRPDAVTAHLLDWLGSVTALRLSTTPSWPARQRARLSPRRSRRCRPGGRAPARPRAPGAPRPA